MVLWGAIPGLPRPHLAQEVVVEEAEHSFRWVAAADGEGHPEVWGCYVAVPSVVEGVVRV